MQVYGEVVIKGRIERGVFKYINGEFTQVEGSRVLEIKPVPLDTHDRAIKEDEEAIARFERDIEGLYFLDAEFGKDAITQFQDLDGGVDAAKLYYQGNDLVMCYRYQDIAYDCLNFIHLMEGQSDISPETHALIPIAKETIERYKRLRQEPTTLDDERRIKLSLGDIKPRKGRGNQPSVEEVYVKQIMGVLNIAKS